MTRTHRSAKTLGTQLERQIADYLATALADDRIDRRAKTGNKDRGDLTGLRIHNQRLIAEIKNTTHQYCPKCHRITGLQLPEWTDQAHTEAGNDDALTGVVIHKRKGSTDMGRQWVTMTVDDLCALISGERHGHRKDIPA
jgi:hypothetical protein